MSCAKPLPPPWRAPQGARLRWATWCCLPMLCAACATPPAPFPERPVIDPPPANLAAPCAEGPPIPGDAVTVAEALDVWAQREAAAAECRDRHRRTIEAWPR
jgi:hypothetical protein